MKEIQAKTLLDCALESPVGTTRAHAVFPFFTHDLETKFLLVVAEEGRILITRDLPTGVVSRVLAYPEQPRLRRIEQVSFARLWHFDPWWLLRDREDVPANTRKAIVATNLAGKAIPDGPIKNMWFDDRLASVTSARIGWKRVPFRLLQPLLEFGPLDSADAI